MPRPVSVIVFGTLNLVFGAFSLVGTAFGLIVQLGLTNAPQPQFSNGYQLYQSIVMPLGMIAIFAQLASGPGLLLLKPWGRKLALGFALYNLIATTVNTAATLYFRADMLAQMGSNMPDPQMEKVFWIAMMATMVVITLIWYAYSISMWYYLTRPAVVAVFRGEVPAARDYGEMGATAATVQADLPAAAPSDNPFDAPVAWNPQQGLVTPSESHANETASMALYLGIGSLIPCLAIGLGPAAVVVARRALAATKLTTHRTGETQAILGMILGGGCFVLNIGMLLLSVVMMVIGVMAQP